MTSAGEEYWRLWKRLGEISDGEYDFLSDQADGAWYAMTAADRGEFKFRVLDYLAKQGEPADAEVARRWLAGA